MDESLYVGREQSRIKHLILQRYLQRFALIIGENWKSITYVDCFSGPWKSQSESYDDTSFSIAIQQLREAKKELASKEKDIELRAFFIEQNQQSFSQLQQFVGAIDDIEIQILNAELEDSVDEIIGFVNSSDSKTFPFIFIDPKGWTGFALDVITPMLKLRTCEVLINFMTQHIVRFIDNEESRGSFERLFGSADFAEELKDAKKEDRVDKAVFKYRDVVSKTGNFDFPGVAGILNPLKDRSHFHLVYLSRHWRGLEVFKTAEKQSMADMESARARVEQEQRKARSGGQIELFGAEDAPESDYFRSLRDRYRELAIGSVESLLTSQTRISFDNALNAWLCYPMVWESDLKDWIQQQSNRVIVDGLTGRQRVPQRKKNHFLRLLSVE